MDKFKLGDKVIITGNVLNKNTGRIIAQSYGIANLPKYKVKVLNKTYSHYYYSNELMLLDEVGELIYG